MFERYLKYRLMDEEGGGDPAPGAADGGGNPAPTGNEPAPAPSGNEPAPAPSGGEPAPAEPFFSQLPEDWRKQVASAAFGDEAEKRMKQLERYGDLPTLIKSGFEAQDRIRRGELGNGLPENPTEEQLAEWRKANNVPEAADQYELRLDDGLVLGDEDRAILEHVFPVAHEANIPADKMSALTSAMLKGRQIQADAAAMRDGQDADSAISTLKSAWGSDFQRNINAAQAMVNRLPEEVRELVESARLADGSGMMNHPEVLRWLSDSMREIDPAATVVGDAHNPVQSINDEIEKLEKQMADGLEDGSWYKDKTANARLEDLYEARERLRMKG
jgi:hypothetical protein